LLLRRIPIPPCQDSLGILTNGAQNPAFSVGCVERLSVGSGAAIRMEVMPGRQKANQENERKQEQNSQITVLGGSSID